MELKVYWTDFAKNELKNIFNYYQNRVNPKTALQIITRIVKEAAKLSTSPKIGTVEKLLRKRPREFRYIISTNYKIIYWINQSKNRIEIVDVFDTRQDPKKINRN